MREDTSDFSGVKVGDKLWSVQLGECEVTHAPLTDKDRIICRQMCFDESLCYNQDGRHMNNDEVPSLFWSRPKIIAPPRPKSKVTKTVEAWISIYPGGMKMFHWNEPVYCGLNCIACVHLTGTYEVFE